MSRQIYLLQRDAGDPTPRMYLTGEAVWTEEEAKQWVAETYNSRSYRNRGYTTVTLKDPPGPPLKEIVEALVMIVMTDKDYAATDETCQNAYRVLYDYQQEVLKRDPGSSEDGEPS